MNKKSFLAGLSLALVIGGIAACSPSDNKIDESEKDKSHDEVGSEVITKAETEPKPVPSPAVEEYSLSEEERNQASQDMGEEEFKEEIAKEEIDEEYWIASSIMSMSFQKVELDENENFEILGAKPRYRPQITKQNIAFLKEKVESIESDPVLEEILNKWSQGNFDSIDKDFIEARNIVNGQDKHDGYKIKKRSEEEEERYIKYFYGEEGLRIHEEQWG
ncbi:DUF6241 domain-containing protein [Siminovitchia sp. 179-K 8D1 HS]|uniref:DUF6241 domain-containing protein n=1 Tax=Siminovitchia sp. 179-K 8D1 HS TaxID=3142385 RepID=UPI00399F1568